MLKKISDYIKAERSEKEYQLVKDHATIEYTNDFYVEAERRFSEILERQAISQGHTVESAKLLMAKNISLRFKLASVSCSISNGFRLGEKSIHEFTFDRARKKGLLHTAFDRFKLQNQSATKSIQITVNFPFIPSKNAIHDIYQTALADDSLLINFANMIRLLQAYHKGLQMGKGIHFQVIFHKSLAYFKAYVERKKQAITEKSLEIGDDIFHCLSSYFLPLFSAESRSKMKEKWYDIIQRTFTLKKDKKEISLNPESSILTALLPKHDIILENMHAINFQKFGVIIDPSGMLGHILDLLSVSWKYIDPELISENEATDFSKRSEEFLICRANESIVKSLDSMILAASKLNDLSPTRKILFAFDSIDEVINFTSVPYYFIMFPDDDSIWHDIIYKKILQRLDQSFHQKKLEESKFRITYNKLKE